MKKKPLGLHSDQLPSTDSSALPTPLLCWLPHSHRRETASVHNATRFKSKQSKRPTGEKPLALGKRSPEAAWHTNYCPLHSMPLF